MGKEGSNGDGDNRGGGGDAGSDGGDGCFQIDDIRGGSGGAEVVVWVVGKRKAGLEAADWKATRNMTRCGGEGGERRGGGGVSEADRKELVWIQSERNTRTTQDPTLFSDIRKQYYHVRTTLYYPSTIQHKHFCLACFI